MNGPGRAEPVHHGQRLQGDPEKFTHRKTLMKIIPECVWKNVLYKTIQKYVQNIVDRRNFEMPISCFD